MKIVDVLNERGSLASYTDREVLVMVAGACSAKHEKIKTEFGEVEANAYRTGLAFAVDRRLAVLRSKK